MPPESPTPHPPLTDLDPSLEAAALEAWLTAAERERLRAFEAEKRRGDWLRGRAAAKQAARAAWQRAGLTPLDWQRFEIGSSEAGAPRLRLLERSREAAAARDLALTLSHGHGRALALALPPGPTGGLPGVDLERVRPRRLGTLRFYLHPAEREPVLALPGGADPREEPDGEPGPRDVAAVVLWALKEAAFKALQPPRGTGLLDVAVDLDAPYLAERGAARVRYLKQAAERAETLGVTAVDAGWRRGGDMIVAWVVAQGGRIPE